MLASFFTQVTALNMIIAIMSDTFEMIKESKEKSERQMKINLLSGYINHIKCIKKTEVKNSFIVLVTPEEIDDVESEWQGSINMIKKTITQMQDDLTYDMNH